MLPLAPAPLALVALAGVVAGHLGWALAARPQRGVLVLAALVPFDGLLLIVPGGGVVASWKEALTLLVLAATFVAPPSARSRVSSSVSPSVSPSVSSSVSPRVAGWVPAAVGLLLLGLASAAYVGGSVGLWGLKVSYFYLLLPVILWRCPLSRTERGHLVSILMVTGSVTAVVGLGQQLVGATRLHELGYSYNDVIRFSGPALRSFSTFTQPFSFGLFMTLVLLVCLPVAMSEPRRPRNAAFLLASPLLVAGMAASVVRGAILGLAVGLVYLAASRYRGLAHAFVPVALSLTLVPTTVLATFLSSHSLHERTTGWSAVFDTLLSAPFGHGVGTTGAAAEKSLELGAPLADVVVLDGRMYQPDNQFVNVALQLGPLGLWLLVLLFVAIVTSARQLARESEGEDRALADGIAAATVAAAVAGLVSTYLEIFPLDLYFWMLAGVLLCDDRSPTSTQPARSGRSVPSAGDPVAAAPRPGSVG